MPAGCDFICNNEDCENHKTGFTMTGPWPLGNINEVINSQRVKELPEFQKQLTQIKKTGREYIAITFPNIDNIETKCYRVSLWSFDAKCIWDYEVLVENGDTLEQAIKKANLPEKCPTTNSDLFNYKDVIKKGINCPHCNKELTQNRWFAKEK